MLNHEPPRIRLDRPVRAAVLTISDTRTPETDRGGPLVCRLAEQGEVRVTETAICADSVDAIQAQLTEWLRQETIDVIITTGGTGIAKRDVTIEAVRPLLDKEIEGFGECFRWLSFTEDVGTRAMLSRALAGVSHDKLLFTLPGSPGAVKLAMTRLIMPELPHFMDEATKHRGSGSSLA